MAQDQPLPRLWLLSDARNDAVLEDSLAALPRGSGFVFRHYHLADEERLARLRELRELARRHEHLLVVAGNAGLARAVGSEGMYGPLPAIVDGQDMLRLATAHDAAEVDAANEAEVDGIFLSPVFATRSHDRSDTLGPMGFSVLAQRSSVPIIALGGMTQDRADLIGWPRWGAIDGLSAPRDA